MVVNAGLAAAFLVRRDRRKQLLLAGLVAAVVLQATRWISPPAQPADRAAILVQANTPILDRLIGPGLLSGDLRDLTTISRNAALQKSSGQNGNASPGLIVWPESPAPFSANDPVFHNAVGNLARESQAWVLTGNIATAVSLAPGAPRSLFNSASLVSPAGDWIARYDKVHLVPFGEYLPFPRLFSFRRRPH